MKANDLMARDVRVCRLNDNLCEAARAMWENDCGVVPIVDDARRVVGMLTDRDICMAAYTQGKPLAEMVVSAVVAKDVVSCRADDDLAVAARTMQKAQVRRLPVVTKEGKLAGLLTLGDLARQAQRDRTSKTRAVSPDDVTATLAAVCEPRQVRSSRDGAAAPAVARAARLMASGSPEPEC